MYRIVKFPSFRISRPQTISTKLCAFCRINDVTATHNLQCKTTNTQFARYQNTDADLRCNKERVKRKRFQKNKRYFTELLEVYGDCSKAVVSETRASVRKLKPGDVSRIAKSPGIELDHLHKIKNKHLPVLKDQANDKGNNAMPICSIPLGSIINSSDENLNSSLSVSMKAPEVPTAGTVITQKRDDCQKYPSKDDLPKNQSTITKHVHKKNDVVVKELEKELHEHLDSFNDPIEVGSLSVPPSNFVTQDLAEEYDHELHNEDLENIGSDTPENCILSSTLKQEKRKKPSLAVTKEKLAKEKFSLLEKKAREQAFNTTLLSYLKLCVSCNYLARGLATLHYYKHRSRISQKHPKITDIRIFEVLMQGFASKAYFNKLNEVWNISVQCGLKPTLNMYAIKLECAAKSEKYREHVPEIIEALQEKGYQLNDIFVNCTFLGNQREVILKAIQEVDPGFKPVVPPPSICYSCALLQDINDLQGKNPHLQSQVEGMFSKEDLQSFAEEQLNNEFAHKIKVKSIEKRLESEENLKVYREKLETMRTSWVKDLRQGFDRDFAVLEMGKRSRHSVSLLPYMKVLHRDSYVEIMLNEITRLAEGSETFSPSTYMLYRGLGEEVRNRYVFKFKKNQGIIDKTKLLYDKYLDWYLDPSTRNGRSLNGRQEWLQLVHEHQKGPTISIGNGFWPNTALLGIGKFLYNIIVGDVKIDVNILNKNNKEHKLPAFYRVYRHQGVKKVEEIKPHPVISKLFRSAAEEHIMFDITQVPMLSPPLPWVNHKFGGYLTAKTDIIRLPGQALQQRQRLKEASAQQLFPPLDSLNQLGSIPWRVNKPVLDTVIEVFNNGGSAKLEIPAPSYLCPVAEPITADMNKQERYEAYRHRITLRRQRSEMYSLWCDALYKLSLANHFRDKIFWLPHNMDFRGRVYPVPPHLNHLGADMSRSLLCFAQGKPLGPQGLDWLKIHLVNLLGTKKRESIQARLEYAETLMPEILDSADKPLTGSKWWMESECPWQTLASCLDIAAAVRHPEGPQHYVSHFPVHQDGSCNGLQHYAALGRDEAGACSVNLMPQELPQDVYGCVAALVERERAKDAAAGVVVAKELDGFVRRKVIKQTVMTTVYGVTRFGARLQIAKQLKDIESFPKAFVWPASTYLVIKTFESLREMFNSTREIQDWFTECARLVSQICGQNMEYVTPLGLPVVQYYTRHTKIHDMGVNKFGHLQEYFPIDMFERPNVMKQKNAFPPNFIHSLDSCHMMLTSIFSEQRGITFVSVHDCYWTHASTVNVMNRICREQFVALHSEPILEELSEFMLNKYGYDQRERNEPNNPSSQTKQKLHDVLAQVPQKGTFVLENVLDSIYFFS
ncbi:DNA-directed RNA polymerase, mitochondrial-like isoform X1 [Macrosteles quadrilineatus]|uniref:DNA-directed RNA polymerase, mitochondrial-like isoform X1 n=1 Tax=Macrosteles quadrilineatus TaxID=74068 RepID=UPI0023E0FA32|nr:DNA-directed RNA polymerase, mitochondrial-like isoform X1 [Macrosteles quadrilineatus]